MPRKQKIVSNLMILAACAYGFFCQPVRSKHCTLIALILYTFSGCTGLMYEISQSVTMGKVDYYSFVLSHLIGMELLVTDVCIDNGMRMYWPYCNLVVPTIDLSVLCVFDEYWQPMAFFTHIISAGLFYVYAVREDKLLLIVSGLCFVLAHYVAQAETEAVGFTALGLLCVECVFSGNDLGLAGKFQESAK